MLGYSGKEYVAKFNPPPVEKVAEVAVVPAPAVDHLGVDRTPPNADNLSATDGSYVEFYSANYQETSWRFPPFTKVTFRIQQLEGAMTTIRAGDQLVFKHTERVTGGEVGGTITLNQPETDIYIYDESGSRTRINVWVEA